MTKTGHTSERLSVIAGTFPTKIKFRNLRVSFQRDESARAAAARDDLFAAAKSSALERLHRKTQWNLHRDEIRRLHRTISIAEDKIDELETRLAHTTDDACVICLGKKRTVAVVHESVSSTDASPRLAQAHLCMCVECAANFTGSACPLCRQNISGFVKLYNTVGRVPPAPSHDLITEL